MSTESREDQIARVKRDSVSAMAVKVHPAAFGAAAAAIPVHVKWAWLLLASMAVGGKVWTTASMLEDKGGLTPAQAADAMRTFLSPGSALRLKAVSIREYAMESEIAIVGEIDRQISLADRQLAFDVRAKRRREHIL